MTEEVAASGWRRLDVSRWRRHDVEELLERPIESFEDAVLRECRSVLEGVGIMDVSTLGKIDVQGPDAARFLETGDTLTDADLDVPFDASVKGTVWLMQAAFPVMRAQGCGRIVTFGSNAALNGVPTYSAYSAAKEAIRAITRTAAAEWGRHGITVNSVCPVSVRHHTPGLDDPERRLEPGRPGAQVDQLVAGGVAVQPAGFGGPGRGHPYVVVGQNRAAAADEVAAGRLDTGISLTASWRDADGAIEALIDRRVNGKAVLLVD